jgi:hypothetical protein
MNKHFALLSACALLALTAPACRDKETDQAGKGGKARLLVTPQHHGVNIDSCMVYIRYKSSDAPGDGRYDDSARCAPVNGKPVATFSELRKGNYYLYGRGWDPQISETVEGGIPYTIPDETEASYPLTLPVTEAGH